MLRNRQPFGSERRERTLASVRLSHQDVAIKTKFGLFLGTFVPGTAHLVPDLAWRTSCFWAALSTPFVVQIDVPVQSGGGKGCEHTYPGETVGAHV